MIDRDARVNVLLDLATPTADRDYGEPVLDLTMHPDIARGFPDGTVDRSTFDHIETALDRAEAPCWDGRRWLTLPERIAALGASIAAADQTEQKLYRFLEAGEIVVKGDEHIADDCLTWEPVMRDAIGYPVARIYKTIRRRVFVLPTR